MKLHKTFSQSLDILLALNDATDESSTSVYFSELIRLSKKKISLKMVLTFDKEIPLFEVEGKFTFRNLLRVRTFD